VVDTLSNPNSNEARGLASRPLEPDVLRFLSQLAHELRTPLTGIKGSIGVVLANEPKDISDAHRRMFHTIDAAADRMEHMIGNLSELVRMQNGQFELYREACDLVALCEHVVELAGNDGQLRGRDVEMSAPEGVVLATVDRSRMERALRNLVVAAAKLLGADGLVAVTFAAEGDDPVVGIAAELVSAGDSETPPTPLDRSASEDRVHLELAVADAIVQRHGGRLDIASTASGGMAFRVRLPFEPLDAEAGSATGSGIGAIGA
jgi:two-component system, OmpR family, phosphate regulon sensor histidine kinase PhoR